MLDNLHNVTSVLPDATTAAAAAGGFIVAFFRTIIDWAWAVLKWAGAPFKGVGFRILLVWHARELYLHLDRVMGAILRTSGDAPQLRISYADALNLLEALDGRPRLVGEARAEAGLSDAAPAAPRKARPARRKKQPVAAQPTPAVDAQPA